jgi:GAF domain-containing protein
MAQALDRLLSTLAEALDIRTVFRQVSTVAREIIPHDLLELGILDEDQTHAQVYAASEGNPEDSPRFRLPEEFRSSLDVDLFIIRDVTRDPETGRLSALLTLGDGTPPRRVDLDLPPDRMRLQMEMGIQSAMRVPVRLKGKTIGALIFFSRRPSEYTPEHVDAALRITDHIALTLAHQRLAEERERAARLEARVESLTAELEAKGPHRAVGNSKKW